MAQSYSPTYFSKTDFTDDIQYLAQKVSHIHPKFLDSEFSYKWKFQLDSVVKTLPDSISFNDGFIKAAQMLSCLKDGHTSLLFSYSERTKYMQHGGVTIPLTVSVKKDKIFINQYLGDNRSVQLSNAEILSINSITAEEILKKMRSLSGSHNDIGIERYFGSYFWMFWGEQQKYQISVATTDSAFSVETVPVSNSAFFELKNKYYPEKIAPNYELAFIDSNSVALLKIKTFADDLAPFLRHAFDTITSKNCTNLIIDIRDNPGGNSRSVDSLLNYLTKKPYTQYASISLRVSDEVKDYYSKKKPDAYQLIAHLPINTSFLFDDSLLVHTPVHKPSFFHGNVFVLTNGRTNSAAATFTGVIKSYRIGKIIGQDTGEKIHYYGDYLTFKLPHMNLELVVSPKEFIQHGGENLDEGVSPDIRLCEDYKTPESLIRQL